MGDIADQDATSSDTDIADRDPGGVGTGARSGVSRLGLIRLRARRSVR